MGERSANPAILKSFKLRFYRFFHIFADIVVANSHENIKLVKKVNPLLSDKKLQVIYNLIDFEKWQPVPENYTFRKNGKFNLIVVASHQYLKNLMGLVEAVNFLNDGEKRQLVINWYGGERPDSSKIEALEKIKEYNLESVFYFHEPTIDIANKVNDADVLGLFSFYEGLPNAVCEAMTNAKPVISSCVSDIPLLLDNDYLFDPNDITGILRVIRRLLSSSEAMLEKIGERNSQIANTKFKKENKVFLLFMLIFNVTIRLPFADRLLLYFSIYQIIYFTYVLNEIKNVENRMFFYIMTIVAAYFVFLEVSVLVEYFHIQTFLYNSNKFRNTHLLMLVKY